MKDERLKVLDMVETGKISVDDAAKLLEALKSNAPERDHELKDDAEDKLNRLSKSVDSFAKDFKEKANTTFKTVEPRLKSATKTAIEKTVSILGDISKSLNETLSNMEENAKKEECSEDEENCGGNGPAPTEEAPVEDAEKKEEE